MTSGQAVIFCNVARSARSHSFLFVIPFIILFSFSAAFAKPFSISSGVAFYRAEEVYGSVLSRSPFSPVWNEVKVGDSVPEGDLLQTLPGSKVWFRYVSAKRSETSLPANMTIKIDTPLVVRVDPDLVRKVAITPNFFENLPSLEALHRNLENEDFSLKSAWSKVTASVGRRDKQPDSKRFNFQKKPEGEGVESSIKAGKIDVLTPFNFQTLRVAQLPHDMMIRWKELAVKNVTFDIYIWQISGQRPGPIGSTRRHQYMLSVPSPGKYFLQIAARDGAWQSEVVTFLISRSMPGLGGGSRLANGSVARNGLDLLYPPESFEIVSASRSVKELFRWESNVGERGNVVYEWVLAYTDGRIYRRIKTSENFTHQEIPQGEYLWSVEVTPEVERPFESHFSSASTPSYLSRRPAAGQPALKIKSRSRSLRVILADQDDQRHRILSEFLKGQSQTAIYLSEGL